MAQANDPYALASRGTPKDAQNMAAILKDTGINDYDPAILSQMLEFTYKYVSGIIEDAQLFSTHAKKKSIDSNDIELAINMQQDRSYTTAPHRDLIVEMARQRNCMSLPLIKSSAGLRLPPDRYSLTSCNYHLKPGVKKTRTVHTVSRLNVTNLPSNSVKSSAVLSTLSKSSPLASIVSKPNATLTTAVVSRPVINAPPKPISTPIIKFTDGNKVISSGSSLSPTPTFITTSNIGSLPQNFVPGVGVISTELKFPMEATSVKRKLEDDDYDVE